MNSILYLSTALSLAIATPLTARTWTDATTGRTLEGAYISPFLPQATVVPGSPAVSAILQSVPAKVC